MSKKERIISMSLLTVLLISIVSCIIMHFFMPGFNWYIGSFIIIFVIIIIGMYGLKLRVGEQISIFRNVLSLLIMDILYLCISQKWTIPTFVFGVMAVIGLYYNIYFVIKIKNQPSKFIDYMIIIDFLIGAGIIIYLIYIIPDKVIQGVLTAIIASLYGGLITLIGVLWTIKNSEKKYQNDILLKYRPLLCILNPHEQKNKIENLIIFNSDNFIGDNFSKGEKNRIYNFFLENGDYSYCSIKGLLINRKDKIMLSNPHLIKKNTRYFVNLSDLEFAYLNPIESISLILIDMMDNYYLWDINFTIEKFQEINTITFNSGIKFKLINSSEL